MSLLTPDNFKNNWYGWIANQWSHALLGQMLFGIIMLCSMHFGEFASRLDVWIAIALGYAGWEVITHKNGFWWDSVEDFIFVCIYGAGWVAFAFHEVTIGSTKFFGDAMTIAPIIGFFAFHSIMGIALRVFGKASE